MARPRPPVTLCTRHAVPAFVIGFELETEAARALVEHPVPGLPPFLALHEHQCGGYSCRQAWILGVTLRFARNEDKAHGRVPLAALGQGFQALGEFGHSEFSTRALHPEVAWMSDLAGTFGHPYDEQDRKLLAETIADAVPGLPPIDVAVEALVCFAPGIPDALLHWRMFTVSEEGPAELGDWNFEEAQYTDELELTEQRAQDLQNFGQAANLGPVRSFLLWENSD